MHIDYEVKTKIQLYLLYALLEGASNNSDPTESSDWTALSNKLEIVWKDAVRGLNLCIIQTYVYMD
jgi:hypothetical protein